MKTWNELEGSKLFNIAFSQPVEIGKIELCTLTLENYQPKLVMQFDISELPDKPPLRWGEFNRCRVGLYCLSISDLLVKNIPCKEHLQMFVEYSSGVFSVSASSANSLIEFKSAFVSLSGPSVYLCEEEF